MCLTLPEVLITVMGIEKLVPTWRDLEVFLQLLPRSSTAERMNPYTSMWTGVTPGDGPQEFHLDPARQRPDRRRSSDTVGRQALRCIRCSACLNVCPVYERTGGQRLRLGLPGPDRRDPHAAAARDRQAPGRRADRVAAVRLVAVRRLLRRLPGPDRHPRGPRPPARARSSAQHGWRATACRARRRSLMAGARRRRSRSPRRLGARGARRRRSAAGCSAGAGGSAGCRLPGLLGGWFRGPRPAGARRRSRSGAGGGGRTAAGDER